MPTRESVPRSGSLTVGWLRRIGYHVFPQLDASLYAYYHDTFFAAAAPSDHERVVPEFTDAELLAMIG
eukprot:9486301-Pyramimonas_sp.AAC.2